VSKQFFKTPAHWLKSYLPKNRPYTELETLLLLERKLYQQDEVSVAYLAKVIKWTRGRLGRLMGREGFACYTNRHTKTAPLKRTSNDTGSEHQTDMLPSMFAPPPQRPLDGRRTGRDTGSGQVVDIKPSSINRRIDVEIEKPSIYFDFSLSLFDELCEVWKERTGKPLTQLKNPGRLKTAQNWERDMRLMHERDGINGTEMRDVWRFAIRDGFWGANIRSLSKLRKQYDQILGQMMQGKSATQKQSVASELTTTSSHPRYKTFVPDSFEGVAGHFDKPESA
jgi:hypothetical protein